MLSKCLGLSVCVAFVLAPGLSAAPPGTAVTGRLLDERGAPVGGAEISLAPVSDSSKWPPAGEVRAFSDPAGRFHFEGLGAGPFELWAAHRGFAPLTVDTIQVLTEKKAVDLGNLTLPAGFTIEGRITDRRGRPLAGAEISIWSMSPGPYLPPWKRGASGADGRFVLEDLPRGGVLDLDVRKAGYATVKIPAVGVPTAEPLRIELAAARFITGRVVGPAGEPVPRAGISRAYAQEIRTGGTGPWRKDGVASLKETDAEGRFRLDDLQEESVDLLISAPGYKDRRISGVEPLEAGGSPLEIALERGESIEGRVVGEQGEPVPNAQITAYSERPAVSTNRATSDAQGRYRIGGLDPGPHTVTAEERPGRSVSAHFVVQPGVNRLDLPFPRRVDVDGRVVDGTGAPVGGARVRLSNRESLGGHGPEGVTAADGTFHLQAADGEYEVSALAEEFAAALFPTPLHVAGAPVRGLVLHLQRAVTLTGKLGGFTPEELHSLRIHAVIRRTPGEVRQGLSGAVSGDSYRLAGMSPGVWTVTVTGFGGRPVEGSIEIEPGMSSATLDFEAPAGLTLSGRLLVDGAPLAGAQIIAQAPGVPSARAEAETAYDGSFRLARLRRGHFQIVASAPEGLGLSREIDLQEDRDITLEISTGVLTGRILDADGQPVADAVVSIDGDDPARGAGFTGPTVRSDKQGGFTVPRLAAGSYKIKVRKDGFAPAESRITVTPGGTAEAELALTAP